jgi:hypothetical protein
MDTTQIRSEVERIQKQVQEWEAKIAPARQELQHWAEILRMRESGTPPTRIPASNPAVEELLVQHRQRELQIDDGYGSKSRALRAFIRARSANGVTMQDLTAESTRLGSHVNMAYRFVSRLTEAKPPELVRRGERIFPTEHLKAE